MPEYYNKEVGVKCPGCNRRYQWDWCQDTYKLTSGPYCIDRELMTYAGEKHPGVTMHQCHCGEVLSFSVLSDDGDMQFDNKDWQDVDWDTENTSV